MDSSPGQPMQGDQAAALGCLDVLCGASALLNRHKLEIAGLLPEYGSRGRGALEQLMADLGEVLGRASGGRGEEDQQLEGSLEEARGGSARPASPRQESRAKRSKRQQQQQAAGQVRPMLQQQEEEQAGQPWPSANRDPLSIEEVLERVMSFAEGRELLGRLSRVCRLWRRVSEAEALCLPVAQRCMLSAVVGKEKSLHARLGGSARRCMTVYNAWMRPGRVMCGAANVDDLRFLVDISCDGQPLVSQLWVGTRSIGDSNTMLQLTGRAGAGAARSCAFSATSLGGPDVRGIFTSGRLKVRLCVMDPASGLTACLFQGPFRHEGPLPEARRSGAGEIVLTFVHGPVPVTSRTYGGPPLKAEWVLHIAPAVRREEDNQNLALLHEDPQRRWRFNVFVVWRLMGQPSIYGEQFIRSRLAEEEAMAATTHSNRC